MNDDKKSMELSILGNLDEKSQNDFYKMISEQFSDKKNNLEFITELSDRDIQNLIRLWVLYEWSGRRLDILPFIMNKFKKMRVSLHRKGRKEMFESFKSQFMQATMEDGHGLRKWFTPRQ